MSFTMSTNTVHLCIFLWVRWLLEFGTFLDTSTNTRHLATVSFILPTNLAHLEEDVGRRLTYRHVLLI